MPLFCLGVHIYYHIFAFFVYVHPADGARGVLFLGCLSACVYVCACVLALAKAFSDQLPVNSWPMPVKSWLVTWHAWFASGCPGRHLSTWPMTAVSCPTALGALCGQLTFRLAWCHERSAVVATELLQPRDLAYGTLFQSSCVIPTSPTDCSDDSWRAPFSGSMNTALCDFWYVAP